MIEARRTPKDGGATFEYGLLAVLIGALVIAAVAQMGAVLFH